MCPDGPSRRSVPYELEKSYLGRTSFGNRMKRSRRLARQRLLHIDKDGRGHQREETDITDRPVPYLDAAIMPVNLTFSFAAITLAARSLTSLISVTSPRTTVRTSVPHC